MDEKQLQFLFENYAKNKGFKDIHEFTDLMNDANSRKVFFDDSNKELGFKDYEDFENTIGVEKKNSVVPSKPLDTSLQLPAQEDNVDYIDLAQQHNSLNKQTKEVEGLGDRGTMQVVPDTEKQKEADKLNEAFKNKGFDAVDLYNETKGLDATDYGKEGFDKKTLLTEREENNPLYQRKLGRLKWEKQLSNSLSNNLVEGNISKEEYDNLNNIIHSSLKNASTGNYEQQRGNINSVANIIKKYGGENKDKLLADYATEVSKVYGNSYKSTSPQTEETPEGKYLTPDAQLGYQYLKDIAPEKAKQYERLFIDAKTLKDKPDEQKGYNHLMQTLEETGISLKENAVDEDLNNLGNIAKRNGGLTPEQLTEADNLQKKKAEIEASKNELDQKYPDRKEDKIDDAMQEILGQKLSFGNYAGGMAGKAIKNTAKGVWEAATSPMMSDGSNNMRELAIMGETLDENKVYHKTDANKNFVTDTLVIKPELQSQIDAINNDKNLTREQKEAKLYPLLKENTDKFGRVPVQGGKFNLNPSSILYGLTDIGTQLLPFVALEAGTGGIGGAGTATKFLRTFTAAAATGFHDEYANAILEGKPQSEAYKQAMGMTAINAAAMAGAGTAEKVKSFYSGSKSSAAKIIEGMSEDAINAALKKGDLKGLKALSASIKDRAKATPKMFAQGAKAGAEFEGAMTAGNELKHQIYDTEIDREQNFKQSILGIANFGLMGAGLGHIGYKSPTELQKSSFVEMGKKPEEFKLAAQQMFKEGNLTTAELSHRELLIDKAAEAQKTLPQANAKGKPLSEKEQADYVYNSVIKSEGVKASQTLPPKQAAKAEHTAMVADHANDLILDPKTATQLETRKKQLEKILEPKKDAEGKVIELPEKEKKDAEAELEAVSNSLEENAVNVEHDNAKKLTEKNEPKLTDLEQKAVDGLKDVNFEGASKIWTDTLHDENATVEQKKQALKEIKEQLSDPQSEVETGTKLGKAADLIYDIIDSEKPKNEETKTEVHDTQETKSTPNEQADKNIESAGEEPPKDYDPSTGVYTEERRTHLSHRGMQEVATEFGLPDVESRDRRSDLRDAKDAELEVEKWHKNKEYSERIESLIDRSLKGEGANPVEKHILQQHIANVRAEAKKIDVNSKEYDAVINELDRLKRAGAMLKSTAGATLRNSGINSNENPTMADWMAERKQSLDVEQLTPEQKQETAKMFTDYEEKLKASEEKQAKADEEIAKLKAELALKSELNQRKTIRKKNREQLQTERDDIIKSIKDKLGKKQNNLSATFVPYADKLVEIAPDVAKLVTNLVETGSSKLSDVVDTIHEVLKDQIDGITKKDVNDVIAGVYNKPKPELSDLQKRVKELRKESKSTSGDYQMQQKLKRVAEEIKDIEERIKNKDYETKKRLPVDDNELLRKANPKLWKETIDAIIAKDEAKDKLELAKRRDELAKRSGIRKAIDFGGKILTTSKAIKAGIDDSITGVQLLMAVLANPRAGVKAKIEAIKDINNTRFKRQLAALHNNKEWWTLIKESGVDITEPKSITKENVEELYSGNLLDTKIGGKINPWTYTGGIFERLFTSMGNNMRLNLFKERVTDLLSENKTFATHPEEYKSAARVVNELTARGKIAEPLQGAMTVISPIVWAPKMISSSLNILGIGDIANALAGKKGYYRSLTPHQQKYAAMQLARGVGVGVTIMGALAMNGWTTDHDPQSSGFGTVTSPDGNRRYNVFGRYSSTARTIVQLFTGTRKNTEGKEQDLDTKGGRGAVLWKYFRGKMTPVAGEVTDYVLNSKRNAFTGKKINLESLPNDLLLPISGTDLQQGLKNDGTESLLNRFLPSLEGIQVQDKRDFVDDLPTLIERNADATTQDKSKIKNYNKVKSGEDISSKQFDDYNKLRNEKITKDLTKMYNDGYPVVRGSEVKVVPYKELTRDEIIDITTKIKKDATLEAKKELFGEKRETVDELKAKFGIKKAEYEWNNKK